MKRILGALIVLLLINFWVFSLLITVIQILSLGKPEVGIGLLGPLVLTILVAPGAWNWMHRRAWRTFRGVGEVEVF